MRAWEIDNIKIAMANLLLKDTFDLFLLEQATIHTSMKIDYDGHLYNGYFPLDTLDKMKEHGDCIAYLEVRNIFYERIKGNIIPPYFKFVLKATNEMIDKICKDYSFNKENVEGMFLNFTYREDRLLITAGISLKNFSQDRTIEDAWCIQMEEFLKKSGINWSSSLK